MNVLDEILSISYFPFSVIVIVIILKLKVEISIDFHFSKIVIRHANCDVWKFIITTAVSTAHRRYPAIQNWPSRLKSGRTNRLQLEKCIIGDIPINLLSVLVTEGKDGQV